MGPGDEHIWLKHGESPLGTGVFWGVPESFIVFESSSYDDILHYNDNIDMN